MSTVKIVLFNVIFSVIVVIGLIGLWRWYESPKKVYQVNVTGPTAANVGDVMHFNAALQNKSFWVRDYILDWHIYDSQGKKVAFQQVDNNDIILGAGVTPTNYTIVVSGIGMSNFMWVHPRLEQLPQSAPLEVMVGGNGPQPNPNPNPNPSPPSTKTVWAIAIFDPASPLLSAQSPIFNSTTIEAKLSPLNADWHVFYTTDIIPTIKGNLPLIKTRWGNVAINTGMPTLIVVDTSGNIIHSVVLPSSEDEIVKIVQGLNR